MAFERYVSRRSADASRVSLQEAGGGVRAMVLSYVDPLNKWVVQTSSHGRDMSPRSRSPYGSPEPLSRGGQSLHMVDLRQLSFVCQGANCPV